MENFSSLLPIVIILGNRELLSLSFSVFPGPHTLLGEEGVDRQQRGYSCILETQLRGVSRPVVGRLLDLSDAKSISALLTEPRECAAKVSRCLGCSSCYSTTRRKKARRRAKCYPLGGGVGSPLTHLLTKTLLRSRVLPPSSPPPVSPRQEVSSSSSIASWRRGSARRITTNK